MTSVCIFNFFSFLSILLFSSYGVAPGSVKKKCMFMRAQLFVNIKQPISSCMTINVCDVHSHVNGTLGIVNFDEFHE